MSYINTSMPRRIAAGFKAGPEWKTTLNTKASGREQRNKDWLYPRYRYSANFGAFNATDRSTLLGLFHVAAGRFSAFRFFDATDYIAAAQSISPSIGTTTAVQLTITRTFGSTTSASPCQAPIAGTVTVYVGATPVAGTLDETTGLFTPTSNWAAGTYTWAGQYERWVRFDNDWGAFVATARDVWMTDMELMEVRL